MTVAIVGGTGLCELPGLELVQEHVLETPLGLPSASVREGLYHGSQVFFLPRHGSEHSIAPHLINYRANMWALKSLGVELIVAVNAVGGIHPEAGPEALVIPDQIIDYSYGRQHTFYTGEAALSGQSLLGQSFTELEHVDFTFPYSQSLRQELLLAAERLSLPVLSEGVYGCTQGPRLETAAEIRRCKHDGCDVVGMTSMPEAALARELSIDYAALCLSVNWGAGLTDELITLDDIRAVVSRGMSKVESLLGAFLYERARR